MTYVKTLNAEEKKEVEWLYWIRRHANGWTQKRYAAQQIIRIENDRDVEL